MRVYNGQARHVVVLSSGLGCGGAPDILWRHVVEDLASDHCVVTWDYRGHGDSSEADGSGAYTASALAADLMAVQDAAGAAMAAHVGFGIGAMVALEHHRWAPERVTALVLIQGGLSLAEGRLPLPASLTRRALGRLVRGSAGLLTSRTRGAPRSATAHTTAMRLNLVGQTCSSRDFDDLVKMFSGQSPRAMREIARALGRHRVADHLSTIKVPTLVVGADKDPLYPERLMRQVHESLHNSEYEVLAGASHALLLDLGPVIAARIRRFFEGRRRQQPW